MSRSPTTMPRTKYASESSRTNNYAWLPNSAFFRPSLQMERLRALQAKRILANQQQMARNSIELPVLHTEWFNVNKWIFDSPRDSKATYVAALCWWPSPPPPSSDARLGDPSIRANKSWSYLRSEPPLSAGSVPGLDPRRKGRGEGPDAKSSTIASGATPSRLVRFLAKTAPSPRRRNGIDWPNRYC
jgi:hypothetical protein